MASPRLSSQAKMTLVSIYLIVIYVFINQTLGLLHAKKMPLSD
jgi:hypothetical protein